MLFQKPTETVLFPGSCRNISITTRLEKISEIFKRSPGANYAAHLIRGCYNSTLYESLITFWEYFGDSSRKEVYTSIGTVAEFIGHLTSKNWFCRHLQSETAEKSWTAEHSIDLWLILFLVVTIVLLFCRCLVLICCGAYNNLKMDLEKHY